MVSARCRKRSTGILVNADSNAGVLNVSYTQCLYSLYCSLHLQCLLYMNVQRSNELITHPLKKGAGLLLNLSVIYTRQFLERSCMSLEQGGHPTLSLFLHRHRKSFYLNMNSNDTSVCLNVKTKTP